MNSYFAYGSNMDVEQMRTRCPGAARGAVARLANHQFLINGRGVATVIPQQGRHVYGLLWSLSDANVEALDGYEGVAAGHYHREQRAVDAAGRSVGALVYVAADSQPASPRQGYLEKIIAAAEVLAFPGAYVDELRGWQSLP